MKELKLTIKSHDDFSFDPGIKIFSLEVSTDKAAWRETYATRLEIDAFIRGAKAAASMTGVMLQVEEST